MKNLTDIPNRPIPGPTHPEGKVKPMILLWALGIPLPIVLIIAMLRGCS